MTSEPTATFHTGGEDTLQPNGASAETDAVVIRDPFPGEFRVIRPLGRGNFGDVWLAEDLSPLGREVALKFLRVAGSPAKREQALGVLSNEARVLATLRHPNIVQVHAWRQAALPSLPCLVLQYVAGGSLEQRVRQHGPLSWQQAGRYVADIADGLLLLHKKGVVHRDVKPANLLHDPETDEALLTDFGIAARLGNLPTIAGTLPYMAPEAFLGEGGPPLDVYGLAASLFWLVTAQTPFAAPNVPILLGNIQRGLPEPDARFACMPAELERLIRAALAADPGRRPSLADFVQRLRGSLNLLLADCLTMPAGPGATVNLRLLVSRQSDSGNVPVASSIQQPVSILRDLKRVPARPASVSLRTGDRVRIEVVADQPGHVTVFNVGPTGNLNLLYPPEADSGSPLLPANQVLHILDVELTPPAGQERLFAVWTRQPLPLRLEELRSLAESGAPPATGAYRATRDMARVQQSLNLVPPRDRHAVVLEMDHQ